MNIAIKQVVVDLLFEKLNRRLGLAAVNRLLIAQQIGEDLDEVRLTRAEITGYPDAYLASHAGIIRVSDPRQIGLEEVAQVAIKLAGHHILIKLSPDDLLIQLLCFHHAIDRPVQLFGKQLFNLH